jgi:hypothetical protein
MSIRPFEPKFMKVGILTAALQELTPREVRDPDPDRAIEEWAEFAKEIGASHMQLSAALHPTETDVPPEAMLDPVANTLDLRKPFDKDRAKRVQAALKATSATSTTSSTTTPPSGRRNTSSCCVCSRRPRCSASTPCVDSSDEISSAAWTRTCSISRSTSFRC